MKSVYLHIFTGLIAMMCLLLPPQVKADTGGRSMMDSDDYHGMMMRRGYGRGYGHGMMGMGPVHMLDLSDDQRKKINAIQDALRKDNWKTRGEIMDDRARLRDLYAADNLDKKAIGKVYDRIFSLKKQMIDRSIDAHNRINGMLTKEQREELRKYRGGMGMGMGMGMGGSGMGMMH